MTVNEAAALIGCGPRLVYRLCKERHLGFVRIGFGRGRIDVTREHVDKYLASRECPPLEPGPAADAPAPPRRVGPRGVLVVDHLAEFRRQRAERAARRGR